MPSSKHAAATAAPLPASPPATSRRHWLKSLGGASVAGVLGSQLVACGGGRVVTIVSLSGLRVKTPRSGLYSVSKFAALALTHAVRQSGWDEGVRAVAVCPGFVVSDMSAAVTDRAPETMNQPDDLARIVAFVLDLPNTASIAELPINSTLEESF